MNYLIPLACFISLWFLIDENNPLTYFKAYRKWRKGCWSKCSSIIPWVPFIWIRLDSDNGERIDENYNIRNY